MQAPHGTRVTLNIDPGFVWKSGKSIAYLQDVVSFAMEDLGLRQLITVSPERNTLCAGALELVGFERLGRQKSDLPGGSNEDTELCFVLGGG